MDEYKLNKLVAVISLLLLILLSIILLWLSTQIDFNEPITKLVENPSDMLPLLLLSIWVSLLGILIFAIDELSELKNEKKD